MEVPHNQIEGLVGGDIKHQQQIVLNIYELLTNVHFLSVDYYFTAETNPKLAAALILTMVMLTSARDMALLSEPRTIMMLSPRYRQLLAEVQEHLSELNPVVRWLMATNVLTL
jgi:hypothetical protein